MTDLERIGQRLVTGFPGTALTPELVQVVKEYKILKFSQLLKANKDTKGWLRIPGTNIDYPVVQGEKNSDFYLHHNLKGDTDKNGCLYIDANCNVETPTKNIVIHGHNMESTRMMFFQLPKYKDIEFYKKHP